MADTSCLQQIRLRPRKVTPGFGIETEPNPDIGIKAIQFRCALQCVNRARHVPIEEVRATKPVGGIAGGHCQRAVHVACRGTPDQRIGDGSHASRNTRQSSTKSPQPLQANRRVKCGGECTIVTYELRQKYQNYQSVHSREFALTGIHLYTTILP